MGSKRWTGASLRIVAMFAMSATLAVPLALPGGSGAAIAAARKPAVKPAAKPAVKPATRRICTTTRVKGKPVRRCRTVAVPAKPVVIMPVVPVVSAITPAMAAANSKSAAPARLPAAPRAPLVPVPATVATPAAPLAAAYFWIDQADGLADVIGNSPPDYAFRHDNVENWSWVSRAGETLIVEPGRDGVVQYYFAPRATAPYLVRDSYYSYGFDGPELMQLYDNAGRIPRGGPSSRQRYDGEDLQRRGRALLSASWRQRQWDSAAAQSWQRQQGYASDTFGSRGSGWNSGWRDEWRSQSDWSAFEHTERSRRPARRLEDERRDRRDAGYRFDQWHRGGARGAPPLPANPIVVPTATPLANPIGSTVSGPVSPSAPIAPRPGPGRPVVSPAVTAPPPVDPPTWIAPATPPPPRLIEPAPAPVPAPVVAAPPPIAEPVSDPAIAAEAERRRSEAEQAAARARAAAEATQALAAQAQAQAAAAQAQADAAALEARRAAAAADARAQAEAARAQAEADAAARPAELVDEPARRLRENEREQ